MNDGDGWKLTTPTGFRIEATLHDLIEEEPAMLPLAGSPKVVILGREVQLGSGYADLVGVETSGRPVIIEVKLASNSEARRAVVAQLLAYAAYLHGHTIETLQRGPLARSLREAEFGTIVDAVIAQDQEGAVESAAFIEALANHLTEGRFRLVFVLDDVPDELQTLVAYLEHTTQDLQIDLIAVGAFDVDGTRIVMPRRITPERHEAAVDQTRRTGSARGVLHEGADEFEAAIAEAPSENRPKLQRLCDWGRSLGELQDVKLFTYVGISDRRTLLPRIQPGDAGLITIWNDKNKAYLSFNRSVFERLAPEFLKPVEELIAPVRLGQGTTTDEISDELLVRLSEAYQSASQR